MVLMSIYVLFKPLKTDGKEYSKMSQETNLLSSGGNDKQMSTDTLSDINRRELVMVTLWERMSDMYGNSWALNYGEPGGQSMQTWGAGLAKYSENQIRKGLEQCRNSSERFPPNLGQFAKLCLIKETPVFEPSKVKKITDLSKSKAGDSAIAKREKKRMRAIMRGEDVESHDESMRLLGLHARWGP